MNKERISTIFAVVFFGFIIWLIGAFTLNTLRSRGILINGPIIECIFGGGIIFIICYIWAAIVAIIKGVDDVK